MLVAYTLGKAIRRPLRELLRVLTEVTQGDMTQRIGFQSKNEFGQLGSQINLLIAQMGRCWHSFHKRLPSLTMPPTAIATPPNQCGRIWRNSGRRPPRSPPP